MKNTTEKFADKMYRLAHSPVPERVREKAQECLLDYLAVVIGGCKTYTKINQEYIEKNKISGSCHVIGLKTAVDLRTAVMINAFNAHVLELDDSHRSAMTHLGAPIFSSLLSVAEIYGSTLDDLIRAAVVGYEAAIRLANAIQPSHKRRGFHVSGTCCTVGCAIGIAALLGYSRKELGNVLSAAATTAAGLLGVISGNSEQKPYNVANAAVAGVNAALYGKYFNGAEDILCDSRGFFRAMCDEFHLEKLFDEGYAIEGIYQKLYAACRHCHAPMEAMLAIRSDTVFDSDKVKKIEVKTYDLAINGHDHTKICGVSSAKQSIPYGVACACLYQDCGLNAFSEERVLDRKLLALTQKVEVKEDTGLTALVPEKRAAIVNVLLADGQQYSRRVDYPKGEPENPITRNEIIKKFYELTRNADMQEAVSARIIDFVFNDGTMPAVWLYQWISCWKKKEKEIEG